MGHQKGSANCEEENELLQNGDCLNGAARVLTEATIWELQTGNQTH